MTQSVADVKAMASVVLLSLGAGCGSMDFGISTDAGDGSATDAAVVDGSRADRRSPVDAGHGGGGEGGHDRASADSGSDAARSKDASSGDAASRTDGSERDATHAIDAGVPTPVDSGKKPDAPVAALTSPVELKSAGTYAVLAETGISIVPSASLTGNVGLSPAAASYITGVPLTVNVTGNYATAPQVVGDVFAASYVTPTPALLTAAIGDMEGAFGDASGRVPGVTGIDEGNLGTMTFSPGVYGWSTAVVVAGNITLDGTATDVWIFQIAQTLTLDMSTHVILTGGALPANVFWQVSGAVVFAGGAHLEGVLLADTSVAMAATASVKGRVLAQTAITIAGEVTIGP